MGRFEVEDLSSRRGDRECYPTGQMMRTLLLYSVLATTILLTSESATAQLGYTTYSIEWLTGASDAIVLATIDNIEVDGLPIAMDAVTRDANARAMIRIRIIERIKGDPGDTMEFMVSEGISRQTLLPWKNSGIKLIWFLMQSETKKPRYQPIGDLIQGDSAIALGPELDDKVQRPVLTSSLVLLDTGTAIVNAIESLSKKNDARRMTKSKQLPIPYDTAILTGRAGDVNVLIVPDE